MKDKRKIFFPDGIFLIFFVFYFLFSYIMQSHKFAIALSEVETGKIIIYVKNHVLPKHNGPDSFSSSFLFLFFCFVHFFPNHSFIRI